MTPRFLYLKINEYYDQSSSIANVTISGVYISTAVSAIYIDAGRGYGWWQHAPSTKFSNGQQVFSLSSNYSLEEKFILYQFTKWYACVLKVFYNTRTSCQHRLETQMLQDMLLYYLPSSSY